MAEFKFNTTVIRMLGALLAQALLARVLSLHMAPQSATHASPAHGAPIRDPTERSLMQPFASSRNQRSRSESWPSASTEPISISISDLDPDFKEYVYQLELRLLRLQTRMREFGQRKRRQREIDKLLSDLHECKRQPREVRRDRPECLCGSDSECVFHME